MVCGEALANVRACPNSRPPTLYSCHRAISEALAHQESRGPRNVEHSRETRTALYPMAYLPAEAGWLHKEQDKHRTAAPVEIDASRPPYHPDDMPPSKPARSASESDCFSALFRFWEPPLQSTQSSRASGKPQWLRSRRNWSAPATQGTAQG